MCTLFFRYNNGACYSAIPPVGAYTRSNDSSILYSTSTLECFEKLIGVEVLLHNVDALVEIYRALCKSIEKSPFQDSYGWNNIGVSQPTLVFSEDLSQNYFINGIIQVDMVNITTNSPSVNMEVCLFTIIDDYHSFKNAGANWKNSVENAICHSVQIATGRDSNSSTFHISKPTFVFVGIAPTDFVSIGTLTITTNGFSLSGPGENSTKLCQMSGQHTTCKFNLLNHESEEVCIVAHEDGNSDGTFDYSNLTIKFATPVNVRFLVCLSVLLTYICIAAVVPLSLVIYKKWRQRKITKTTEPLSNPTQDSSEHESPPTVNSPAHGKQSLAEQCKYL